jgi:hypothetical protein
MTGYLLEKWETGQGNTGKPAANAVGRKKGNTPGSQKDRRGEQKAAAESALGGGPEFTLLKYRQHTGLQSHVPIGGLSA